MMPLALRTWLNAAARTGTVRHFGWLIVGAATLAMAHIAGASPKQSPALDITSHGEAHAVLVAVPGTPDQSVAQELQHYVQLLTGANLPLKSPEEAARTATSVSWIVVGSPQTNPLVRLAAEDAHLDFAGLKTDGFFLKALALSGHRALIVGGNSDAATMYAGYDLLERWGIVFLLTGDIIPTVRPTLPWAELSVRSEPAFSRRGLNTWFGYPNMSVMSAADLQRLVAQMAKMKMNYLQVGWLPYEPWLRYEYHGEPKLMGDVTAKESGYLLWRRDYGSYKTSDLPVGQQAFKSAAIYPRLESPEFQSIENNEDAFRIARTYMRSFLAAAQEKKIKVWLQIDAASLPPNLARYTTITADAPFHPVFGSFICPNNPVSWELNSIRLKSLFDTYPGVEGYFLYLPELYPVCEASQADRDFYRNLRVQYPGEAERVKVFTGDIDQKRAIDSNSGSIYLIQKLMAARDLFAPQVKLGIAGLGRLYLLPNLDSMFPKSVPFTDMESSAVWTPSGVPMEMFGGMGDRERTLSNRIDDDSAMLGMQFNVSLYDKDKVLEGALKNNLAGFASQVSRPRGTETNTKYMAEGEWNPHLTPDEFYEDYSRRIFGQAASSTMLKAFQLLEKNEAFLGWSGARNFNCCAAISQLAIAYDLYKQPNLFEGPHTGYWKSYVADAPKEIAQFSGSVTLLQSALAELEAARPDAAQGSQAYLAYLIEHTRAYILFLQTLIAWDQAYLDLDHVFQARSRGLAPDDFVRQLDRVAEEFAQVHRQATEMTEMWARSVDHPSDLGSLYRLNVFLVTGSELATQLVQSIDNFHHGKPYFEAIPFDKVFVTWPALDRQQ